MFVAYWKLRKNKKYALSKEAIVAFQKYYQQSEKVKEYLRENQMFYTSSYNNESRTRGLVVIEAYYGLADHIYQIEAGTLMFKIPENFEEYSKNQLLPVTKQLQIQVKDNQLVLEKNFESLRGVFNPCLNLKSKRLLYLRYKFRDVENVLIYDFNRDALNVPGDVV